MDAARTSGGDSMNTQDFQKFHEGMVGVMSFYNKDVSQFSLDVWWNALKQFELSAITEAFNRHLMNPDSGQFQPKPADIVRMLQGSTQDSALSAWAKVDKAVRHIGTYRSVVFDDPLIHVVLHDMGGWIAMGQKTEDEWPFVAKEFENRYRGFKARNEVPDYNRVLIGLSDANNQKEGFQSQAPMLIGNEAKAKQVMLQGHDRVSIGFKPASSEIMRQIMNKSEVAA
jgi:hypothetical protein